MTKAEFDKMVNEDIQRLIAKAQEAAKAEEAEEAEEAILAK